jgi:hypothetical protein
MTIGFVLAGFIRFLGALVIAGQMRVMLSLGDVIT